MTKIAPPPEAPADQAAGSAPPPSLEVLAIRVGAQDYAIPIEHVREIRGWSPVTPLPSGPPALLGVVNLRGSVLSVLDLSAALGDAPLQPGPRSVVVVIEHRGAMQGLLIDGVTDIKPLPNDTIQPVPSGRDGAVAALHNTGDGLLRILDVAALGLNALGGEGRDAGR